jgi:uncharacterized protein
LEARGVAGRKPAIGEQASDVISCLELLQCEVGGPVGLYGHSQGGWVVIEAAARFTEAAFVISSSEPGVTPERQERYATHVRLTRAGIAKGEIEEVRRYYDDIVSMMRAGAAFEDARMGRREGLPEDVRDPRDPCATR